MRVILNCIILVAAAWADTEVFGIQSAAGRYKITTRDDAKRLCMAYNAKLASEADLLEAYRNGLDLCNCGWLTDQVGLPLQSPRPGCGDAPGIRYCPDNPRDWGNAGWDAFCLKDKAVECRNEYSFGVPLAKYAVQHSDWAQLFLNMRFPADGKVVGWDYYSLRPDVQAYAAVWRPTGDADSPTYQLVSRSRLPLGRVGHVTYFVDDHYQIEVKKNDFVGVHYDSIINWNGKPYTVIPLAEGPDKLCSDDGQCVSQDQLYQTVGLHRHEQQLTFRRGYVLNTDIVKEKSNHVRAPALRPIMCANNGDDLPTHTTTTTAAPVTSPENTTPGETPLPETPAPETEAPEVTQATEKTEATDQTEATSQKEEATEQTQATENTEATEKTEEPAGTEEATEQSEVTEKTDATEQTESPAGTEEATEQTEDTEQTEATEHTEAPEQTGEATEHTEEATEETEATEQTDVTEETEPPTTEKPAPTTTTTQAETTVSETSVHATTEAASGVTEAGEVDVAEAASRDVPCHFPFMYRKQLVYACTMVASAQPWCSTEEIYDGSHWRYCHDDDVKIEDLPCHFPFTYKGSQYKACTRINSNKAWCSVKAEYSQHAWKYCNADETSVEQLPCHIPFEYNGKQQNMCIKAGSANFWCATEAKYGPSAWRNCHDDDPIPASMACHYPFLFEGKEINTCIEKGANKPWCSVEAEYNGENWRYCREGDKFPEEKPCHLPFEYNGKKIHKCISDNSNKPWCSTIPVYDYRKDWRYCRNVELVLLHDKKVKTIAEAHQACKAENMVLAMKRDAVAAYELGTETCECGWVVDGVAVSLIHDPRKNCGENGPRGVNTCDASDQGYVPICTVEQ